MFGTCANIIGDFPSEKYKSYMYFIAIKTVFCQGLVQSQQNLQSQSSSTSTLTEDSVLLENGCLRKVDNGSCPVCQEQLSNQKMVFQCGHMICCKCKFAPVLISLELLRRHCLKKKNYK